MPRPSGRIALPYVNNLPVILFTVALNLLLALLFQYGRELTQFSFVLDAAICGATTSVIDVVYVRLAMRRLRQKGALPANAPESRLMRGLPKTPAGLAAVFAVCFAALTAAFAYLVARFFEIEVYAFARFAVWKVVYSAFLSAKIIELAVLRYVQPDCAQADDPPQTGAETVKNPLPRAETFKNLFNTVVEDFGFNMAVGLLLGGTTVVGHEVVIAATTRAGIVVGGLILGLLITFRMVLPVAKSILALREGGQLPASPKRNPWVAWLPEKPLRFALALLLPTMALSAGVMWAVLTFFGFETLNFFQYFVIRTIYATLLSKLVVALAILRYVQPQK